MLGRVVVSPRDARSFLDSKCSGTEGKVFDYRGILGARTRYRSGVGARIRGTPSS